jgi:DNA-binding CsgD family transcriptional regulator
MLGYNTLNISEHRRELLEALESMLAIDVVTPRDVAEEAVERVIQVLAADLACVLMYDGSRRALRAIYVGDTPLGEALRANGLDHLQLTNGGLAVSVFKSGKALWTSRADETGELAGVSTGLGVKSEIIAPVEVAGDSWGVLMVCAIRRDHFLPDEDLPFLTAIARWLGVMLHRSELLEPSGPESATQLDADAEDRLFPLTPRQQEVAILIANGLTNLEIAGALNLSRGSARNIVVQTLHRIGATRRTQVAAWVTGRLHPSSRGSGVLGIGADFDLADATERLAATAP